MKGAPISSPESEAVPTVPAYPVVKEPRLLALRRLVPRPVAGATRPCRPGSRPAEPRGSASRQARAPRPHGRRHATAPPTRGGGAPSTARSPAASRLRSTAGSGGESGESDKRCRTCGFSWSGGGAHDRRLLIARAGQASARGNQNLEKPFSIMGGVNEASRDQRRGGA